MAENGYIILADITGYTRYLNDSELEHAQEIITSLINAILKPLHPPILISRVEGDAVFAYTTGEAFYQGQTLLDALENLYFEFSRNLEINDRNTTCTCNACSNMKSLDLKIVVHYGEFGLQQLGRQTDLIGRDVNITHRLLKNSIIKKTGVKAYIFLTWAAIDRMKMDEFPESLIRHAERYDDVGEIEGFVYDLKPAWLAEREKRRIVVEIQDAFLNVVYDLPVPPALVWDFLNEPMVRACYRRYEITPVAGKTNGRIAVGATYHCVHGERVIPETIVDWKPFEYVTFRTFSKLIGQEVLGDFTSHIQPQNGGSRVTFSFGRWKAGKMTFANRLIVALLNPFLKVLVKADVEKAMGILKEIIREHQETGSIDFKARLAH